MNKTIFKMQFFFIVCIFSTILLAQVYEFPKDNWKTPYKSYNEKVTILQVPNEILINMSTEDLVQTCLNYPLLSSIWLYNNSYEGLEWIIKDFNGLRELLIREDADIELLKKYKKMNPHMLSTDWKAIKRGEFCAEFVFIEMLFARKEILIKLKKNDRNTLLKESITKHDSMVRHGGYDIVNFMPNLILMGKILQKENYYGLYSQFKDKDELNMLLNNGTYILSNTAKKIVKIAKQYLNENN